jgi:hypothetical protein
MDDTLVRVTFESPKEAAAALESLATVMAIHTDKPGPGSNRFLHTSRLVNSSERDVAEALNAIYDRLVEIEAGLAELARSTCETLAEAGAGFAGSRRECARVIKGIEGLPWGAEYLIRYGG